MSKSKKKVVKPVEPNIFEKSFDIFVAQIGDEVLLNKILETYYGHKVYIQDAIAALQRNIGDCKSEIRSLSRSEKKLYAPSLNTELKKYVSLTKQHQRSISSVNKIIKQIENLLVDIKKLNA